MIQAAENSFSELYNTFFIERTNAKRLLYSKIMYLGISILFFGLLGYLLGIFFQDNVIIFDAAFVLATFLRVLGVCILSTLPTTEIDCFDVLLKRRFLYKLFVIFGSILGTLGGLFRLYPPFTGFFFFPVSLWIFLNIFHQPPPNEINFRSAYKNLSFKIHMIVLLLYGAVFWVDSFYLSLLDGNYISQVPELVPWSLGSIIPLPLLDASMTTVIGFITWIIAVLHCYLDYRAYAKPGYSEEVSGWRVNTMYTIIYYWSLQACLTFLAVGISRSIRDEPIWNVLVQFIGAFADLLPMAALLTFGKKKCFTLVARWFEYDLARLKKDGSALSAILLQSERFEKCRFQGGVEEVRWIHRKLVRTGVVSLAGQVDRSRWILARVLPVESFPELYKDCKSNELVVEVDVEDDNDPSWFAYFESDRLVRCEGQSQSQGGRAKDNSRRRQSGRESSLVEGEVASWKEVNLDLGKLRVLGQGLGLGRVRLGIEQLLFEEDAAGLLAFTEATLREYRWPVGLLEMQLDFANLRNMSGESAVFLGRVRRKLAQVDWPGIVSVNVFNQSPRDSSGDLDTNKTKNAPLAEDSKLLEGVEKEEGVEEEEVEQQQGTRPKMSQPSKAEYNKALYGLSAPVQRSNRIDYFLSHSWSDDPALKFAVVDSFAASFKRRRGRSPSLWLDKICIDQQRMDPRAFIIFPVVHACCSKMLVCLSDTYLTRIWCVWELFTLLTFCNKELAMERIELLLLGEGGLRWKGVDHLRNFNLDEAHCYDPNEEFRLRRVIYNIGIDRFRGCLREMADELEYTIMRDIARRYPSELLQSFLCCFREGHQMESSQVWPGKAHDPNDAV